MAKRFGNAVLFALPALAGETNPIDVLLVESMRVFFPRLYMWVRSHEADVVGETRRSDTTHEATIRDAFTEATTGLTAQERDGARVLLNELFPRTESAWQNKSWGSDWTATWASEKRIATSAYFSRYFTYAVPAGDVRDADIETVLTMLADPTIEIVAIADLATTLMLDGGDETFISKFQQIADDLPIETASRAAVLLMALGPEYSDRVAFLGLSTFERGAALVTRLVARLPEPDREQVLGAILRAANPLGFAVEVYRWAQAKARTPQGDVELLSPMALADVGTALALRISDSWSAGELFTDVGRRVGAALFIWSTYQGPTVCAALTEWVSQDPAHASQLIRSFLGRSWSMDTGVPIEADVHRETYDAILEYVDAGVLVEALHAAFGTEIDTEDYYSSENLVGDARLASQFVFLHGAAQSKANSGQDEAVIEDGTTEV